MEYADGCLALCSVEASVYNSEYLWVPLDLVAQLDQTVTNLMCHNLYVCEEFA